MVHSESLSAALDVRHRGPAENPTRPCSELLLTDSRDTAPPRLGDLLANGSVNLLDELLAPHSTGTKISLVAELSRSSTIVLY